MKAQVIGGYKAQVSVYKGDDLLVSGTIAECAKALGVQPGTIYFYLMPSYQRRVARRKTTSGNTMAVVLL